MGKKKHKNKAKAAKRAKKAAQNRHIERELDKQDFQQQLDELRIEAWERQMDADQILYDRWTAKRGTAPKDWVGEIVEVPTEMSLWPITIGEKVAALGGHLEVTAVFGGERITLLKEPTLAESSIHPATGTMILSDALAQRLAEFAEESTGGYVPRAAHPDAAEDDEG